MICPRCRTENNDEDLFCRECGAELLEDEEVSLSEDKHQRHDDYVAAIKKNLETKYLWQNKPVVISPQGLREIDLSVETALEPYLPNLTPSDPNQFFNNLLTQIAREFGLTLKPVPVRPTTSPLTAVKKAAPVTGAKDEELPAFTASVYKIRRRLNKAWSITLFVGVAALWFVTHLLLALFALSYIELALLFSTETLILGSLAVTHILWLNFSQGKMLQIQKGLMWPSAISAITLGAVVSYMIIGPFGRGVDAWISVLAVSILVGCLFSAYLSNLFNRKVAESR